MINFFDNFIEFLYLKLNNIDNLKFNKFYYNFQKDYRFLNIEFIMNNLINNSQIPYKIKCILINKKYKKILKSKFMYKISYVKDNYRKLILFRQLYGLVFNSEIRAYRNRIKSILFNIILNFDNSEIKIMKKKILKYLIT